MSVNKAYLALTFFFASALPLPINAYAESFSFSGYLKSYALAQDSIPIKQMPIEDNSIASITNNAEQGQTSSIPANFQSQNALRLMASYLSSSKGNVEIDYEIQPLYFSNSDMAGYYNQDNLASISGTVSLANNQYRYKDLNAVLTDIGNNGVVLQNLDRFNYQYSNQYGDLTIGRQVLSFGSARFINPTDIFIPFAIQTLNQEYRVGIDVIRYKADVGDFAVVDMGLVIGEGGKKQNIAAFLRGKNSLSGNDIELIAIILDDAWLVGGGIERAIGDFGFWFEAAFMDWQQSDTSESHNAEGLSTNPLTPIETVPYSESYWRSSIGSDYALNEDVIIMIEYHYNGAGSNNTDDYTKLATQAPYQKAGVYLYGQHYIVPALTWLASPLVSVNASAFYNVSDSSVFLTLSSETSWSDNVYSDFGVYVSHGESMIYQGSSDNVNYSFGSEFGAYPLSIYASLRYYF
ncbi:hypothetical protein [Colwellia psychrerythraea]|uniref:Alginate export domain-containing protein n=1 Tax=Colwellia psychrerythraea TaxID=28229 RepID=A0A099L4G8_COLPS|nr:hypothetical protein [Colwellia psychrerythraea]KGJ96758.1 hypothetical protein GAB14E_1634 [Colwellia psychrerythraea]